MFLIKNIVFQQTTSFVSVITFLALIIFVIIILVVGANGNIKEKKQKENWIKNNSEKLKIQDDFLLKFISQLSKLTPKCNKCLNGVYNIWDITSSELTIRCCDCKKKYIIDLDSDSEIAVGILSEYIDLVQLAHSHSNEKLREYLINELLIYDFSFLRSNQPLIRAIKFETHSEKVAVSTRLNFKLVGYNIYHSFNEKEYFDEDNVLLQDLDNYLKDSETIDSVNLAFKENPEADEITFLIPAIILGVQKKVVVHKNTIAKKNNDSNNTTKKRSRRISQTTKDKVWRRDEGKCVECGSNEKLEFDHIIPFSKGGSNNYRNIQLLCESCNRSKSDKIG